MSVGLGDFKLKFDSSLDGDTITVSHCAALFHLLCSHYLQEDYQQHKGKTAEVILPFQ